MWPTYVDVAYFLCTCALWQVPFTYIMLTFQVEYARNATAEGSFYCSSYMKQQQVELGMDKRHHHSAREETG